MRILIADDHPIVREGLKCLLAKEWPGATFGEASEGLEALRLIREQSWDIAILDITMPGRNGLEVLGDLKAMRPDLPVLVLTIHPEEQYAVRAFKAGAAGYLTKESASKELVTAVHKVVAGGRYVSPALAEKLVDTLSGNPYAPRHQLLSDREFQVLCGIASGRTVSEIAREMSLSVKTVSSYRARLLEKMKMRTNAELTVYAVHNGLG